MKNKKGFTLIELMVIIGIMALISIIVIPSLQAARIKAKNSYRLSSLIQLRNALNLYYADNQKYPSTVSGNVILWVDSYHNPSDYIVGLVPKYIPSLPQDPDSSPLCFGGADEQGTGFRYISDGQTFKIHLHCAPNFKNTNRNSTFYHCPNTGTPPEYGARHIQSWSICQGPGCPDIWCVND